MSNDLRLLLVHHPGCPDPAASVRVFLPPEPTSHVRPTQPSAPLWACDERDHRPVSPTLQGGDMRRTRDVAALSEFVEARSASLFRTAYLMVGDHQLAHDLLQEALVKTLVDWPRLRDNAPVEAYTRRIIVNPSPTWRRSKSFHARPTETLPET